MAVLKTQKTKTSVSQFLTTIEDVEKRNDSKKLLKLFTETTKEKGVIWGTAIIGFGSFHYQSEKSKQAGDWFMCGFSPRKQALTVYIISGVKNYPKLLAKLGKFKPSGGSCLYIKKLSDINMDVLKALIAESYRDMKLKYG